MSSFGLIEINMELSHIYLAVRNIWEQDQNSTLFFSWNSKLNFWRKVWKSWGGEREVMIASIRKFYFYSSQNLWGWSRLPLQTTTCSRGPGFRVLILYCGLQHAAPKFQMWWRTSDELVESCSKIPNFWTRLNKSQICPIRYFFHALIMCLKSFGIRINYATPVDNFKKFLQ